MSRGKVLTDKNGRPFSYENIRTQGWLDGQRHGLDAGVDFLNRKANEMLQRGEYAEGFAMRKLALEMRDSIRPVLERRAVEHKTSHPEELDATVDDDSGH